MGLIDWLFTPWATPEVAAPTPAPQLPGPAAPRSDGISNAMTGLGTGYDKGQAGRPNPYRQVLTDGEIRAAFRYTLGRRLCEIVPDWGTRRGWEVTGDDDVEDIQTEDDRLKLDSHVRDAWTWARRDGTCLLYMVLDEPGGLRGTADLTKPPRSVKRILNLVPIERAECSVSEWETDWKSPIFRQPRIWSIATEGGTLRVHASRVLVFRGAKLSPRDRRQNAGHDDSWIEAVWDQLRDVMSTGQVAAALAQQLSVKVLKIGGLSAVEEGDVAGTLADKLTTLMRGIGILKMVPLAEEDVLETLNESVAGFEALDEAGWTRIHAVTGIPRTVFLGEAPGGLSTDGTSQKENWNGKVAAEQKNDIEDPLKQFYGMAYAQTEGPTKGKVPEAWKLGFRPLDQPTSKQVAEERKLIAETDAIEIDAAIVTPEHVARSRHGAKGYSAEMLEVTEEELNNREAMAEVLADQARIQAEQDAAKKQGDQDPAEEEEEEPVE